MLSIVIPIYNEAENIRNTMNAIAQNIHVLSEVIVIYDSEDDNTLPVIDEMCKTFPFPVRKEKNLFGNGALNAIHTGMKISYGDAVLIVMADLSDNLNVVDAMYQKIITEGYDLVCGSRYMKGGKQYGGPILKGLLSRCAGLSLHILAGIPTHDVTNSFKMYRKELLETIRIESTGGFEIGMEITVKAYLYGFKVTEVPAEWHDRTSGKSKFHMWKWMPHYLHWYFLCLFKKDY